MPLGNEDGHKDDGNGEPSHQFRRRSWRPHRRQLMGALAVAGTGLLAGCPDVAGPESGNGSTADTSDSETAEDDDEPTEGEPEGELQDVSLSAETIPAGNVVTVTVRIRNVGGTGVVEIPVKFGGITVDDTTVELDAGETAAVELTATVDFRGTEPVVVAGEAVGEITGEPPATIHVDPAGTEQATGTSPDPFGTIQSALDVAQPGHTVHVSPGTYTTQVQTVRAGTTEEPITITGPREAVYRSQAPFEINHSHIHLTGLTFNGLLDPDSPEDDNVYSESLLQVNETFFERIKNGERSNDEPVSDEEYLVDVVVKPEAVGNCRADFVKIHWSRNVEIGEFEVIGPAGVKYLYGDSVGHNGEIVYVGNPIGKGYPIDVSRDIHIHHIDNSAGYEHNELVDVKGGARNVLVEYCTDSGGGRYVLDEADDTSECVVHLGGRKCVLRWCAIEDSQGQAVEVGSWDIAHPEEFEENKGVDFPEEAESFGRENSIYGNEFRDHDGLAVQYPVVYSEADGLEIAEGYGPEDQRHVCGNEIDGPSHGSPAIDCETDLPTTDQIGHRGGNSPWT
ncbi:DUF1565 domain-containing protein [Halorubrum sp. AS12]|uniref:COG1470 family protein n=1 Tax=Halorubrum sp. AS12 TaxID=3409687 RepID=UPI003DA733C3